MIHILLLELAGRTPAGGSPGQFYFADFRSAVTTWLTGPTVDHQTLLETALAIPSVNIIT